MYIPLEEGEEVIAKVHKHWWFIFLRAVTAVILLSVPFWLWLLGRTLNLLVVVQAGPGAWLTLGALWALVGWVLFWQFWTLYYMDMWVVTNRRLIDIDYIGFFDRNIAMLRLERIQDLTVKVDDFFGNILGYGSLLVQTAGSDKEFIVEQISNPDALRDLISRYAGKANVVSK